jgi:hypothetical protein
MDRYQVLMDALYAGGVYGAARVFVAVCFPPIASYLWQTIIGPSVVKRWPGFVQHEDFSRYSYIAADNSQPYVWRWMAEPPLHDLNQGLRDAMALGLLVAVVPDLGPLILTGFLGILIAKFVIRLSKTKGAGQTDLAFDAAKDLLLFMSMVAAIRASGFLPQ